MATFTNPLRAKVGPVATQNLVNDHAARIEELQGAIAELQIGGQGLYGEDTDFLAIRDGRLVTYIIKAIQSESFEEA